VKDRKVVYDAGVLIALEKRDRKAFDRHLRFLDDGVHVIVPVVAAAQAVREPARQARLMRVLGASRIEPFTREHHVQVGKLLSAAGTCDVVDAFVVLLAVRGGAAIYTSDIDDITHLVRTLDVELPVLAA